MDSGSVAEKRKAIRLQYGKLFDALSKLLFELDPISINFETNTDEYEPEVGTIIPRLTHAESEADVREIVHEEFCKWFDSKTAGPIENYDAIAPRICMEWQRHK
jgi:hypothetical protein